MPTDFSNNSYNALYYAARLFSNEQCTFHMVNVCSGENDPDMEKAKLESAQGLDCNMVFNYLLYGSTKKGTLA